MDKEPPRAGQGGGGFKAVAPEKPGRTAGGASLGRTQQIQPQTERENQWKTEHNHNQEARQGIGLLPVRRAETITRLRDLGPATRSTKEGAKEKMRIWRNRVSGTVCQKLTWTALRVRLTVQETPVTRRESKLMFNKPAATCRRASESSSLTGDITKKNPIIKW